MIKRRNTTTQEAVLAVLKSKKKAMSQDAVLQLMDVDADRATVYRILNRFCKDGIVHKIVADDGKQYFAICDSCEGLPPIPANHFHFRCTQCETIECLAEPITYSVPENYIVQHTNCILVGVCKDCR
jgi:Fur family ferric uptake transcriptional regulator